MDKAYDELPADIRIGKIEFASIGKQTDDPDSYAEHRVILDALISTHNAVVTSGEDVDLHFPVFFTGGPGRAEAFASAVICVAGNEQQQDVCRNRSYWFFRDFEIDGDTQRIFDNIVGNSEWYRPCQYVWASGAPDPRKTAEGQE